MSTSDISVKNSSVNIVAIILAAAFFFGIGIIAVLPPFEGMDETAHFSRLQSEAFAAQLRASASSKDKAAVFDDSQLNSSHITQDVNDYYRRGPMPYMWIDLDILHRLDPIKGGYHTYHDFFNDPALVDSYIKSYREHPLPTEYRPSPELNWQYQHPPLYYLALMPVMKVLAGHLTLNSILFVLRFLSWGFAYAGFVISILATRKYLTATGVRNSEIITAAAALSPFMMPMFFWEFARLGNDSLCMLIFGLLWAALLAHLRKPCGETAIYLGILLGLGALTKLLVVPMAIGVISFLAVYHCFVLRHKEAHAKGWWVTPLQTLGYFLMVAGPGYVMNFIGSEQFGAGEFSRALKTPNAVDSFFHNFVWSEALNAMWNTYASTLYLFGSWSKIVLNRIIVMMPEYLAELVLAGYVLTLWLRQRKEPVAYLPIFCLLPLVAGLVLHIVAMTVFHPQNTWTPGYYLYTVAPALALLYGLGTAWLLTSWRRVGAIIFLPTCTFVIMSNFYIVIASMTVFSGCAVPIQKDAGGYLYLVHFSAVKECVAQTPLVIDNLSVLAWPDTALGCFVLAFLLLLGSVAVVSRQAICRGRVLS